jgi:hypothetical protein
LDRNRRARARLRSPRVERRTNSGTPQPRPYAGERAVVVVAAASGYRPRRGGAAPRDGHPPCEPRIPNGGGGGGCNTYTRHTSLSFIPSQPRIVPVPVSLCPGLSRGAGKRTDRQTYYRPTGGVGLETRSQRVYLRSDCLPTVYRYARSVPAQRRGIPRSTTAPARARVRGV